ncbi:MAG: hypothetical protein ACT4QB_07225, partial [Gammaproteobacteria bacterium]
HGGFHHQQGPPALDPLCLLSQDPRRPGAPRAQGQDGGAGHDVTASKIPAEVSWRVVTVENPPIPWRNKARRTGCLPAL